MTEPEQDQDIPALSGSEEELEDDAEFCKCSVAKTGAFIRKNKNKCPDPNCGKN